MKINHLEILHIAPIMNLCLKIVFPKRTIYKSHRYRANIIISTDPLEIGFSLKVNFINIGRIICILPKIFQK